MGLYLEWLRGFGAMQSVFTFILGVDLDIPQLPKDYEAKLSTANKSTIFFTLAMFILATQEDTLNLQKIQICGERSFPDPSPSPSLPPHSLSSTVQSE